MIDLTNRIGRALDTKRQLQLGIQSTLSLLNHAGPGLRGYTVIAQVQQGWSVEAGGLNQPTTLYIVEVGSVNRLAIGSAVAFAINGAVYKVEENNFVAPLGVINRLWKFQIKPVGPREIVNPVTGELI